MSIKSIPDNQGWSAGGYNFYVAEDGTLSKGRPGEVPMAIGAPQELLDFSDTFALPAVDGAAGTVLITNGAGGLSFARRGFDFIQDAIPTATAVNQLWYRPGEGIYFWSGLYWLSTHTIQKEFAPIESASLASTTSSYIQAVHVPQNHWLESLVLTFRNGSGNNNSNYFTVTSSLVSEGSTTTYLGGSTIDTRNYVAAGSPDSYTITRTIGTPVTANRSVFTSFRLDFTLFGTAGVYYGSTVTYRRIAV